MLQSLWRFVTMAEDTFWKAKGASEELPVKFRGSVIAGSSPIVELPVRDLQPEANAVKPADPECPYCGSGDHMDAMRCGKYLKSSMLEQTAQTAALRSIRRCAVFFVVMSIIGILLGFVIAIIDAGGRR
jgi:hypothetical protein